MQYDVNDWLNLRAGNVLVPLGRFNINHDDNRWDIPRRSLVPRVLPSTLTRSRLGFFGSTKITGIWPLSSNPGRCRHVFPASVDL